MPADVLGWTTLVVVGTALLGLGAGLDLRKASAGPPPWRALLRALAVALIVVPTAAMGVGWAFDLRGPPLAGLLLIAVSPGAPLAARRSHTAGNDAAFSIMLQVAVALTAFLAVPGWIALMSRLYGARVSIDVATVAGQIAQIQLLPLGLGLLLAGRAPGLGRRIAPLLSAASGVFLILLVAAILVRSWSDLIVVPPHAALASLVVTASGLALGHAAGGPSLVNRRASAVVCALRNPGIALLIATMNGLPPETRAMILAHVLLAAIAVAAYLAMTSPERPPTRDGVEP